MVKVALLIGASEYGEGLSPLLGAAKDVEAIQRVLQNPEMGNFDEVRPLLNVDPQVMQEAI
nr:caspase family protein [Mastigocladopsis repens]